MFRLYRNRDVIGVALCGALKNIIAIAAGAVDGLGFGDNGKAGLITRGLAEIEGTLPGVAEGAYTVDTALAMAERLGVEMPIAQEVHNALFEGKSVQRCLADLLARESKDELADFEGWVQMVTQRFREERAVAVRPGSPGGDGLSS